MFNVVRFCCCVVILINFVYKLFLYFTEIFYQAETSQRIYRNKNDNNNNNENKKTKKKNNVDQECGSWLSAFIRNS